MFAGESHSLGDKTIFDFVRCESFRSVVAAHLPGLDMRIDDFMTTDDFWTHPHLFKCLDDFFNDVMHAKRILHRDLAARNALVKSTKPYDVKLADFGREH
jgi:serine/threonine protein kinase